MENVDIAERLEHMGTLLQLTGANPFKSRAYDRAARTIRSLTEDVAELAREGKVGELKGIGDSIKTFITQTLENGESDDFKELSEKVPEGLFEILKLPGVGPKKVQKLWEELGITSLAELSYACNENRLVELKGFGKKSQAKITEAIKHQAANRGRHLYPFAEAIAKDLVAFLKGLDEVEQVDRVEDRVLLLPRVAPELIRRDARHRARGASTSQRAHRGRLGAGGGGYGPAAG